MGIKCSIFGHAFGETTVEREREEQGSEVVITIRETKTCERCGETRIVSENKEVTTVETPEDASLGEQMAESGPNEDSTAPDIEGATDAMDEPDHTGAEIVDAEAGKPVSPEEESEPPEQSPSEAVDTPDPEEDDGVILEEDSEPDREAGEWPDDEIDEMLEEEEPAVSTEAEPAEEPTTAIKDEAVQESEVWSETDPDLGREQTPPVTAVPEGYFRCPECGFETPVESSSLREGDFCPKCHQGALVHDTE